MSLFRKARNFVRNIFSCRSVDADLDQEIHSHFEMLTDENLCAGMPSDKAQRAARLELGGIEQVKEQVREQRLGNWLRSVLADCRYGLRQFGKNPGFTTVTVLTIALGIGANTALFTVIDAVLLRPLPFHDPGCLVAVRSIDIADASQGGEISYPAFLDWRAQSHSFQAMSVNTAAHPPAICPRPCKNPSPTTTSASFVFPFSKAAPLIHVTERKRRR
jgi:hypothetical protein